MSEECLFCRIVEGEVPADVVRRTERVLAFRDVDPKAPTHVLVIPLAHHADVGALAREDGELLVDLGRVAAEVGEAESPGGWRLVFNTGAQAGQTVFHVHGHVLGGRGLGWPPG